MSDFFFLIPVALALGAAGLTAFLWSLRNGQYEDLDGAAERVLLADAADAPLHQVELDSDAAKNRSKSGGRREGRRRSSTS